MISDIRLQNFRSYKDDSFEFEPGVNIIVGPNASGKTNLLEAILVLARGKSYRAKDSELVNFKSAWARLEGHSQFGERVVKLETDGQLTKKTFVIDGKTYHRPSWYKLLPTALFEPNHLPLLTGSPELRRNFLDSLIEQLVEGYTKVLAQYKRALAQRNALLKSPQSVRERLFAWNVRLSELGGQIVSQRVVLLKKLNKEVGKLYSHIAGAKTKVGLEYSSAGDIDNYSSGLLKKLESTVETDIQRGFTGHGPHREDLLILVDNHPMQETASRGEARTLVLALKILELHLLEAAYDKPPLLLLDDVFSELDGARRRALTEYLKGYQTFITTTDADIVVKHFMSTSNIIALT